MTTNPLTQIRKDLVQLAQLAIDAGSFLPADKMQVDHERKVRRILKKYDFKIKQSPEYKATWK